MRTILVALAVLVPSIAMADAVTLDFSSGTVVSSVGGEVFEYTEGGMTVKTLGAPSAYDNYFFTGGGILASQVVDGLGVVFTASNGGVFDVLSVDLYPRITDSDIYPRPHSFLASSGAILITNSVGSLTFSGNGWTNLTSLTLFRDTSRTVISLDNFSFNVHSVPEPSTLAIVMLGLVLLASVHKWFRPRTV